MSTTTARDQATAWIMVPPGADSTDATAVALEAWADWLEAVGVPVTRIHRQAGGNHPLQGGPCTDGIPPRRLPRWILIPEIVLEQRGQPVTVPETVPLDLQSGGNPLDCPAPLVLVIPTDASPPWHLLGGEHGAEGFNPVSLALLAAGLSLLPKAPEDD